MSFYFLFSVAFNFTTYHVKNKNQNELESYFNNIKKYYFSYKLDIDNLIEFINMNI